MNIVVKLYAEVVTRHVINVRASSVIISACLHVILVGERAVETVTVCFNVLIVEMTPIAEDATMAKSILLMSAVVVKKSLALNVFLLMQDAGLV